MRNRHILWVLLLCWVGMANAQTYRVGDLYTAPDGSQGIVYYLLPDRSGGWVVALNDASEGCYWGNFVNVPGLADQSSSYRQLVMNDTAGYTNTQIMRDFHNNNPEYASGKVDFENGWYLPAPAQLRMLYARMPFISSALENAGGSGLYASCYWSSAEYGSSYALGVSFQENNSGSIDYFSKAFGCRVRAVRSFTYPTYQWSTGETSSDIQVVADRGTQYTVSVTNGSGCASVATHRPAIGGVQCMQIEASNDTVCVGDSTVLRAVFEIPDSSIFTIAPPVASGDILCTDGSIVKPAAFTASGKTAMGVVFYVDTTNLHGWAMDLHDLNQAYPWTPDEGNFFDVSTLVNKDSSRNAIFDFDGYGNTQKLRAAGDATLFPAAWAVDFNNGWYLPAIGQMSQMYAQFFLLNASLQLVNGTPFSLESTYSYWSSTENNTNNAWNLLHGGSPRADLKNNNCLIRGVRDF